MPLLSWVPTAPAALRLASPCLPPYRNVKKEAVPSSWSSTTFILFLINPKIFSKNFLTEKAL